LTETVFIGHQAKGTASNCAKMFMRLVLGIIIIRQLYVSNGRFEFRGPHYCTIFRDYPVCPLTVTTLTQGHLVMEEAFYQFQLECKIER
jgi:hypothetical protein